MDTSAVEVLRSSPPEEVISDTRSETIPVADATPLPPTDNALVQDILPDQAQSSSDASHNQELHPEVVTSDEAVPPQNNLFQSIQSHQSDETESTGAEQEGHIENLARLLADNLCRENNTTGSNSVFNFEEFESEQEYHDHHERLQQHLYQQHVLHQQEMQRQQDRLRRQHLSIITPDSSRYSALPSPGSKFFKQTPMHTPQSGNRNQSPTWYRAEDNATYINRSGSPCSRKDRLYEVGSIVLS